MAVTGIAASWLGFPFLFALLAGGGAALPIGGAPLPLDETLSAIAPEECLWYGSSSGQTAPDAGSDNQTEQLFAEPQVQRLAEEIEKQIMRAIQMNARGGREERVLAQELPALVKTLMVRPFVLYVEEVQVNEQEKSAAVDAAFVLNAGENREQVKQSIEKLWQLAPPEATTEETVAGVTWKRVKTPPEAPAVRIGWKDDYFIVAVGENTPQQLFDRMERGSAPAWLTDMRKEHPVERELALGYLNIAGILERVKPFVEKEGPGDKGKENWQAVEKLGLTSIEAFHTVSGYDKLNCKTMAHLKTDGQRKGLLSLLPYKALSKSDLQTIPNNPMLAGAYCIDVSEVLDNAIQIASQFDPRAEDNVEQAFWKIQSETGVDFRRDVLDSLGDVWIGYLPGGDLMSSWLNSAVAVKVKDKERLEGAISRLVKLAKEQQNRRGRDAYRRRGQVSVEESQVGEYRFFTMHVTGEAFPFAPTWCVSDDWLVAGLMPNAVRDVLDRSEQDSLADVEIIKDQLDDSPAVIGYVDTPQLVRSVYPWVQMGVQAMAGELRREGIDIDTTALPSVEVIVKHLRPGVSSMSHQRDGFHFVSHHSLPGSGNLMAAAPVTVALLVPAVGNARFAEQTMQEINDLRQLALAFHNYHDSHGRFPANIYDEEGKALLSWRVQLLPYLEEQQLYDRFNLDESWDSEHNKQLIPLMPELLKSPSGEAPQGKTRFVALAGDETFFPGDQELSFRDVTDGTSNTLMFVQANVDSAVEWTKPADLPFDAKKPFAGLKNDKGFFLGAMGDGSVHRFSLGIGADVMRALATRAGGEVIDRKAWNLQPAQPVMEDVAEPVEVDIEVDVLEDAPR